jgi:hypothetical protein
MVRHTVSALLNAQDHSAWVSENPIRGGLRMAPWDGVCASSFLSRVMGERGCRQDGVFLLEPTRILWLESLCCCWLSGPLCVYAVLVLMWQSVPSFLQHTQLPLRVIGAEEFVDELEFFLGICPL